MDKSEKVGLAIIVAISVFSVAFVLINTHNPLPLVMSQNGSWQGLDEHGDYIFLVTVEIKNIGDSGKIRVTCRVWDEFGSLWEVTKRKTLNLDSGETETVNFQIVVPIELAETYYNLRYKVTV